MWYRLLNSRQEGGGTHAGYCAPQARPARDRLDRGCGTDRRLSVGPLEGSTASPVVFRGLPASSSEGRCLFMLLSARFKLALVTIGSVVTAALIGGCPWGP